MAVHIIELSDGYLGGFWKIVKCFVGIKVKIRCAYSFVNRIKGNDRVVVY